jgi:hypothetical protein
MHNHSAGSQQHTASLSVQWYSRRDGVVRGPFSSENVTRYILLGRIRHSDELSIDRQIWLEAEQVSGVMPDVMTRPGSRDEYQLYLEERMLADERVASRRCATCKNCGNCKQERRQLPDRRSTESRQLSAQRVAGQIPPHYRHHYFSSRLRHLLLTVILASLLFVWLVPVSR